MLEVRDLTRTLRSLRAGGLVVNQAVARALADAVLEEFEQLVIETPQYTGTAAASWNIGSGAGTSGKVRLQNQGITREEVIRRKLMAGHQHAVDIAVTRAEAAVEAYKDKGYRTGDLVIWNDAPSAEYAEEGPLRAVNDPPGTGAAAKFEARMQRRLIIVSENINVVP